MTALLVVLALVAATGLAWWLVPWRRLLPAPAVAQSLGALGTTALADQPAAMPWVASLSAQTASRGTVGDPVPLVAGDWYDPTASSYVQTFNEFGFITSPSPAPVDPKTGAVPMTNADVCAWVGHAPGNPCPRCGVPRVG